MSYFKQLAARTSGDLPILKPPRSPFLQLGTTQAIESFAEQIAPTTPTAPSFPAIDRVGKSSIDTIGISSPVIFENSTEPNSPLTFENPKSSEVIIDQQSSSFTGIDSPQDRLPQNKIKITSTTQPKLVPNPPLEFRSVRDRGNESEGKEIKRERLPRLSPRDNDNFSSTDENLSSLIGSRLSVKSVPNSAPTNRIQIGLIEIQIIPPAPPPLPVIPISKTAIRLPKADQRSSTSTTSLSRGFNSSFGLRQG
jgi:hypothetical protein